MTFSQPFDSLRLSRTLQQAVSATTVVLLSAFGVSAYAETESRAYCRALAGSKSVYKDELFSWAADAPTSMVQTCYVDEVSPKATFISASKGEAKAAYGTLKSFSGSENDGSKTNGAGSSKAMFRESLLLKAPGYEGQRLYVTASLDFSVTYTPSVDSAGSMGLDFLLEPTTYDGSGYGYGLLSFRRGWYFSDAFYSHETGVGTFGANSVSLTFFALEGMSLDVQVALMTNTWGIGDGQVSVDAGNSTYWGGMKVYSTDGKEVAFSAIGQSGFDYSKAVSAVDEVPTVLSLSAGLLLLSLRARKRKLQN